MQAGQPQCDIGAGNVQPCIPGVDVSNVDFPTVAVNPGSGAVYAAWTDYRSGEFDIQLARSLDGG